MIYGFVGTGAITEAIVTGLSAEGGPAPAIRLSPRNADVAAGLAARFTNVSVSSSNQAVLDECGTVVLAIRPQVAEEVLTALRIAPEQIVISLVAGFPAARVAELVRPATRIWRAIPLPAVAQRRSPVAVYPPEGAAAELFAPLGQVVGIEKEEHLNALSAATSTMAAYFALIGHIASWVAGHGLPERQARLYVAQLFAGLAGTGMECSDRTAAELTAAHATPGGLNEQFLRHLTRAGVLETFTEGLDAVHLRATGKGRGAD